MEQQKRRPLPQQIYRHFKGNMYQVQSIAYHSETGEEMVVYQALYGDYRYYVRPLAMFIEEVDRQKYPNENQKYRFELVDITTLEKRSNSSSGQSLQPAYAVQSTQSVVQSTQTEESVPVSDVASSEELVAELDEDVVRFLDANNYEERLEILTSMKYKITDDMIDIMSTVIDIEVKSGSVERRYEDFKNALLTRKHYEGTRLR